MNPGFWAIDPDTDELVWILYSELDEDERRQLFKPIGGFCFEANKFLYMKLAKAPFYVQDWLPKRGKCMIYAPAKSGKSFLSMQMARCIASGEEFLGLRTTQGRVLYIQFEMGEEILQDRLTLTKKDYENVYVGTSFSLKLDTEPGKNQLNVAMEAVQPNVLILDPLYKAIIGDENSGQEMRSVLDYLDELIEGYDCSILLIHHTGKDLTKRGRGTSIFEDWVDSYIAMKRLSKDNEPLKVMIKTVLMRHAISGDSLEAVLVNFEFEPGEKTMTVKKRVFEFIKNAKKLPISPDLIFKADIGSNNSVYKALKALIEEGVIEKVGYGQYQLKKA